MKIKQLVLGAVLVVGSLLGTVMAQESTWTMEVKDRVPVVEEVKGGNVTSGELKPFKSTYVFGSVGSTMNGRSSTVATVGIGQDVFKFADGHVILGVEGAVTHFTGKRLNDVNNTKAGGFAVVDNKNMLELGVKLSYQFNETDPLNVRLYGKAGVASTTLKNASDITPYVGGGVEFAVKDSNFVWFGEVKHYTDLRKAKVYYAEDRGQRFNTRKDNTVMSVGLQYRF